MSEAVSQEEVDFEEAFASRAKPAPKKAGKTEPQQEPVLDQEPEPQGDKPTEPEPKTEQPTDQPDELEKLRRELAQAQHAARSDASRQSNLMRESNQLKDQIRALQAQVAELQAKAPAAPAPAASADVLDDVLEEAPDLKAAVESRIAKALTPLREQLDAANLKLAEVDQTANRAAQGIEPLASREEARQIESVHEQLDKSFKDWRGDIRTPEFGKWLEQQTAEIQTMFKTGKTFAAAGTVMKLFYADRGAPQGGANASGSANEERLANAAGIKPRVATKTAVNNDDFEGAFSEFAAKKR